jgi:hypothetical protein
MLVAVGFTKSVEKMMRKETTAIREQRECSK